MLCFHTTERVLFQISEPTRRHEAYKQLAARLDVRFVDAGQWDLPVAFDGVHLTQQGHRIFADELFNYLKEGE